jgi:hypothetical protein
VLWLCFGCALDVLWLCLVVGKLCLYLLLDTDAERMMSRACIFEWANLNLPDASEDRRDTTKHDVFYTSERAHEFADLEPSRPDDSNQFEPFLSPRVLVRN